MNNYSVQYPTIPIAPHTGNQWVIDDDGTETISNAVYKLVCCYRVVHPRYAGPKKRCHTVRWRFTTNAITIPLPLYLCASGKDYENAVIKDWRRLFATEGEARAFFEKKKASFAKYFTEVFPPIPPQYLHYFLGTDT